MIQPFSLNPALFELERLNEPHLSNHSLDIHQDSIPVNMKEEKIILFRSYALEPIFYRLAMWGGPQTLDREIDQLSSDCVKCPGREPWQVGLT